MILHHSHANHAAIGRCAREASRGRIGMIVLGSIVTMLGLLNLAASLA
jgi:hypothetical protein